MCLRRKSDDPVTNVNVILEITTQKIPADPRTKPFLLPSNFLLIIINCISIGY